MSKAVKQMVIDQIRGRLGECRELVDQLIDFLFCADIDAARGLIEQEQFGHEAEPFAEDDFLLISAGKVADGLSIAGGLDPHALDHVGGDTIFGGRVEKAA